MDKQRLSKINSLRRPLIIRKGKDGLPGKDGSDGQKGDIGLRGEKGEKGNTGPIGRSGSIGPQGLPGQKGQPGQDGIDGRGITWRAQWESNSSYELNDGVFNLGSAYICKLAHKSGVMNQPGIGSQRDKYWSLLAERGEAGPGGAAGANGSQGGQGPAGAAGAAGPGVAAGGTTNQILAKNSNADYDTKWEDAPAGGSTPRATISFLFNIDTTSAGTRQQSLNSGTGATTLVSGGYTYSTGATSGSVSRGLLNNTILKIPFFDKNPAIFFGAVAVIPSGDFDIVLYCGGSGGPPATATSVHFGFRFNRTSGVDTIYATNANGTTETATDITGLISAVGTQKSLYAVMTSGTNIKYYYDGTLVATHTTNLPSANPTLVASQWGIINNTAATSTLQIGSVSLSFDMD